jgi:hypothetical protein
LRYFQNRPIILADLADQVVPLEDLAGKEAAMRRDELMKTDVVSEIVLLTTGTVVVITLIVTVMATLTRLASLP